MAIQIDGDSGVSGVNGSATTPALQGTDSNTGIVFGTDEVQIATGGSNRATVDSSGNVGIGTSSPHGNAGTNLHVHGSNTTAELRLTNTTTGTGANGGVIQQGGNTLYVLNLEAGNIAFENNGSERARIDSSGRLMVNKTSQTITTTGVSLRGSSDSHFTTDGTNVIALNRLSSDGNLIEFYQASSYEGNIAISGSTVSYNGGHLTRWSQLAAGAERTEILRGSVLSNLDEMCEWGYEARDAVLYTEEDELPEGVSVGDVKTPAIAAGTEDNEQLNRMKVSDVEGDPNVSGVFQGWDDDDDTYTNDFYCAMTGDFVIRIAQGTTVARGDLLMSAGDGTAKPQDDDIVRSKTIAKVTSTTVSTTYSDGSYCVPCVLMAC